MSIQAKANTTIQAKANTPGDIYEQEADQRPVQQHAPLSPNLTLHRVPGNQASGHLVQLKLSVGALDDPYEREADRVADQVMRMPEPRVQWQMETEKGNEEEETDEIIQAKSASQILRQDGVDREGPVQTKSSYTQLPHVAPAIESEIQTFQQSSGQPLPSRVRTSMEAYFGHDFSRVRVHDDTKASWLAKELSAQAYTIGHHIFFGAGQYRPLSLSGKRLLAHELVHTIQQNPKVNVRGNTKDGIKSGFPAAFASTNPKNTRMSNLTKDAAKGVGEDLSYRSEKGVIQLARGTGKTKNIRGMEFETDEDGNLIITPDIILKTMRDTYDKYLKDEDKWSGPGHVKEVMSKLDTIFYDISRDPTYKHNKFVVDGDPLALEYTAEQVNYLGVGMGFNHFHIFGHFFLTAQAMVLAWNLTEYGHLASPGEHYWADVGFDLYYFFP